MTRLLSAFVSSGEIERDFWKHGKSRVGSTYVCISSTYMLLAAYLTLKKIRRKIQVSRALKHRAYVVATGSKYGYTHNLAQK